MDTWVIWVSGQALKLSVEIFVTKISNMTMKTWKEQQITGFMKCIIFHGNVNRTHCIRATALSQDRTMHMHKCASSEKKKKKKKKEYTIPNRRAEGSEEKKPNVRINMIWWLVC